MLLHGAFSEKTNSEDIVEGENNNNHNKKKKQNLIIDIKKK